VKPYGAARRKAKVGDAYYQRAQLGRLLPVPRLGKRTPVRGHARYIYRASKP